MKVLENIKKYIDWIFIFISCTGLLGLMLLITSGVITRSIWGFSIPAGYELTERYLMPIAIFPALAYAFSSGVMPRVDLFVEKIKSYPIKRLVYMVSILFELIVFGAFAYLMVQYMMYAQQNNIGFNASSINFPLFPIYILIALSLIWLSITIAIRLIKLVRAKDHYNPYSESTID